MFRVSCLGIWWLHNIWISENLKFDYLKNEKSFRSEIKIFCLALQVYSFRHTKQTSKNVADTIFKRRPHKMIKHTGTIRRKQPTNGLSVFDHFVGLELKGLKMSLSRDDQKNLENFKVYFISSWPQIFA